MEPRAVLEGRDLGRPAAMLLLRSRSLRASLVLVIASQSIACLAENPELFEAEDDGAADDDGEPLPSWHSLVRADAWQPDHAEDDPRPEHRPSQVECEDGWYPESGGIEIDTGACNYLSLGQPLLVDIEPGDPVHLQLWVRVCDNWADSEADLAALGFDPV